MSTRCPNCRNRLIQKAGNRVRLRTEGIHELHEDGIWYAKCHWCKAVVPIPIQLTLDLQQISGERFGIRTSQVKA